MKQPITETSSTTNEDDNDTVEEVEEGSQTKYIHYNNKKDFDDFSTSLFLDEHMIIQNFHEEQQCRKTSPPTHPIKDIEKQTQVKEIIRYFETSRALQSLTQTFELENQRVSLILQKESHRRAQLHAPYQEPSSSCPICLYPVPYSSNARFICCGTRLCTACQHEWTLQEKGHTSLLRDSDTSDEKRRNAWTSLKSLKTCPCCRSTLPNREQKLKLLEQSIQQGKGWAYTSIGLYMRDGLEGYPQQREKSFEFLKKGAQAGDSYAQLTIAMYYIQGRDVGCGRSYEKAYFWLKKCVDKGMANGQVLMGKFYEYGHFVKQNIEEAIRLYTLAAAQASFGGIQSLLSLMSQRMKCEDNNSWEEICNIELYWAIQLAEDQSYIGYAMLAHLIHEMHFLYHPFTLIYDKFGCGVSPYPLAKRLIKRAKELELEKDLHFNDELNDSSIQYYIDSVTKSLSSFESKCAGDCGKGVKNGTPLHACSKW